MAIKRLTLICDYCDEYEDDHVDLDEALEEGWFLVKGAEREFGANGERVYCSKECLSADL